MKSQSELNWVFILIAGAIILAFFTAFAFKYKSLQDEKTSIEILSTLDNSLTSLKTSPYATFDTINLPIDVQVKCNNIVINEKSYATRNLLFSPEKLNKKMLIYYKSFKEPFKIADFYFLTDLNSKYHLVYDSSTQSYVISLINNLPQELQSKFSYSTNRKTQAFTKNVEIKNLNNYLRTDNINSNNNYLKVDNFNLHKNDELVYAAIFSDDFECMNEKIKLEINKAVSIYKNKAMTLKHENCNYNSLIGYLDNLKDDLSYSNSISAINTELSSNNCPTLY